MTTFLRNNLIIPKKNQLSDIPKNITQIKVNKKKNYLYMYKINLAQEYLSGAPNGPGI